jgi:hypothetical protein
MGLKIVKEFVVNDIAVLGDSMLIIRDMINHGDLGSNFLRDILARTHFLASMFEKLVFFHIKREIKSTMDRWTKMTSYLNEGTLV